LFETHWRLITGGVFEKKDAFKTRISFEISCLLKTKETFEKDLTLKTK